MPSEDARYSAFFDQARERAKQQKLIETQQFSEIQHQSTSHPWGAYDTPIPRIEQNMGRLLGKPYRTFFEERRDEKQGKFIYVMDVMGTGGYTKHYPVDREVDVTLVDFRTDEQIAKDDKKGKFVVAGDILQGRTWRDVKDTYSDFKDFEGFDLISCRPFGGWGILKGEQLSTDPHALLTEWIAVNRMVSFLHTKGGTLLVEMSGAQDYKDWTSQLQNVQGIEAACSGNFVKIVRQTKQYGKLPRLDSH